MADEAIHIGPAASSDSYLKIENILSACAECGADAVYPGYGFLSENAQFAAALDEKNIEFIGPGVRAIESMGDKITSKKLAIDAGVSTVPGHTDIISDADHAVRIAGDIGYPVMLKASAGGGGKGMRVAFDDAECRDGFERASNEARTSFGDDRVFIEKFIQQPRHIEIQVLADKHGKAIYLNERECSIQRRHQKVIEEAPSPFLNAQTRAAMGEQACALAAAVDYHSAGTVEFIVDADQNFYFLEMNTRLQVEHPVTEMITGFDLVEQMIRVAAGKPLEISQADVPINGWSMEARIYAENPFREFLPSTGRLIRYSEPANMENVRVDSGVVEGGEVSIYYDPMIAKLVTWGADRNAAIATMTRALDRYGIDGVTTNIPFLSALFTHQQFIDGDFSTNFIAEHYPQGFTEPDASASELERMHAAAAVAHFILRRQASSTSGTLFPSSPMISSRFVIADNEQGQHPVEVSASDSGSYDLQLAGKTMQMHTDWSPAQRVIQGTIDGNDFIFQWQRSHTGYQVSSGKLSRDVQIMSPRAAELYVHMPIRKPVDTSLFLLSPMPGLLVNLMVAEGDTVRAGDPLAVVEAMKMENVLKAERDGTIAIVHQDIGATLDVDQKIIEFEQPS